MMLAGLSELLRQSEEEQAEKSLSPACGAKSCTRKVDRIKVDIGSSPEDKDIWSPNELPSEYALQDWNDERPEPEYEILYRQDLMSEDLFLGMTEKTPGSECCSHMVFKIYFPSCKQQELQLDILEEHMVAASSRHRLSTYLPKPVDAHNGKARWNPQNNMLQIILPIIT